MADGKIDVLSKSNNGDLDKILATVIQTILAFLAFYPTKKVVFTGSTPFLTRLYQILLSKEFDKVKEILDIMGITDDKLERFQRNQTYIGFVKSK